MTKVGMVLEGGAMRGIYTAGVLDVLLENKIKIDSIIGVSAGALLGVNYYSKQKGRAIRYSKKYCRDLRYISIFSYLFTGNIINKDFAFYKVSKELDPFDDETFKNCRGKFYATVTNILTGKPEYIEIKSVIDDMEVLRASSAMPLVSNIVEIGNKKYLDGAISDSIPVVKMKSMRFDRIIVVLTQDKKYRKEDLGEKEIKKIEKKYSDYPKLIESIINRPNFYNKTLEKIVDLERKQEIFVIRPSKKLNVKHIERNKNKIQDAYDLGVNDTKKILKKLKDYLEI